LHDAALVSVVEAGRVLHRAPHRLARFCLGLSIVEATAGMLWGIGLLFVLPGVVGQALLGDVWLSAAALIVPTTLIVMAGGLRDGATTGLRALGVARNSLRAQLITAAAYLAGGSLAPHSTVHTARHGVSQ
jgi:hypothetical protein